MGDYNNKKYRFYVLSTLTLVYAVNFVDRQLLAILQESIRADLLLSDKQLGLLTGFSFALFYVIAGIPIARLADRSNRRNIVAVSIAIWSFMTAVCGYANNFVQLAFARMGVGIGEAGCSPPAHSMISDMYPPEQRATALSFYSVGINIGIMFGFLFGGFFNEYFGWRKTFMLIGLPGLLIAAWVRFTITEPQRGWSENKVVAATTGSFKQALKFITSNRVLVHVSLGAAMSAIAGYGLTQWSASFFIRSHGMQTGELGVWLAAGAGIFGSIGTFGWGYFCDRFGRRDRRWYMWLPTIAILLAIPFILVVLLHTNTRVALIASLFPAAFTTAYLGSSLSVFHATVEPRMRATASALFFLVINIFGLGLGAFIVGSLSDFLSPRFAEESLRYALLIVMPIACVWTALHFLLAARSMQNENPQAVSGA